jgi:hypothetical protein
MNLAFIQAPTPQDFKPATPRPKENDEGKPRADLTPRQQEQAIAKAKEFLKANAGKLDPTIANQIKADKAKVAVDKVSGDVTATEATGTAIGRIGRFNGQTLDTKDSLRTGRFVVKK